MAEDKPSLTPHRDAVERAYASQAPHRVGMNVATQLASDVNYGIHRALADARDRGATIDNLLDFAPTLINRAAKTICEHFCLDPVDEAAVALLLQATTPKYKLRQVAAANEEFQGPVKGGRA